MPAFHVRQIFRVGSERPPKVSEEPQKALTGTEQSSEPTPFSVRPPLKSYCLWGRQTLPRQPSWKRSISTVPQHGEGELPRKSGKSVELKILYTVTAKSVAVDNVYEFPNVSLVMSVLIKYNFFRLFKHVSCARC